MPMQADCGAWLSSRPGVSCSDTPTGPIFDVPTDGLLAIAEDLDADGYVLSSLTAVDRVDRIDVVVHFVGDPTQVIALRIGVAPGGALPSLSRIWPGADWQERETAEMFGVVFEDHPDPRRLLLTDDFVGNPLLKSFVLDEEESS